MNEFLDKLESYPDTHKYGAVAGIVLFLFVGFYFMKYSPAQEEIQKLDNEIRKLEAEIQKGEAMKQQEKELLKEVARLDKQLKEALEVLPDKKTLARFLKKVENLAVDVGLSVERFVPKGERVDGFKGTAPIEINVKGDFHAVGRFFERLANEKRIVNVASLRIVGIRENRFTINADMEVLALYFTG